MDNLAFSNILKTVADGHITLYVTREPIDDVEEEQVTIVVRSDEQGEDAFEHVIKANHITIDLNETNR